MKVIAISIEGFGVLEFKNVTNIAWNNNVATITHGSGSSAVSTLSYIVQIIP